MGLNFRYLSLSQIELVDILFYSHSLIADSPTLSIITKFLNGQFFQPQGLPQLTPWNLLCQFHLQNEFLAIRGK